MIKEIFDISNYTFNIYAIPTSLTATVSFFLGCIVLIRERASITSILFFLLTLAVSVWLFTVSLVYFTTSEQVAILWTKVLLTFGVIFIPAIVYHFTVTILGIYEKYKKFVWASWTISVFFIGIVSGTNQFIVGMYKYFWGYYPAYGWLGALFVMFFFIMMIASLRHYWIEYKKLKPLSTDVINHVSINKQRIKTLMIAISIGYLASVDYFAVLGIPIYPFGYIPIIIFLLISAYSVWSYHLVPLTPEFIASQILETMQGAVIVTDLEGNIRVVNRALCEMLGYRNSEIINFSMDKITKQSDEIRSDNIIHSGVIRNRETIWYAKDGMPVNVSVSASVIVNRKNSPQGIVYVAVDITERIYTEYVTTSLKEKELLLKEIHHRVKNNLQVISSLLTLQTRYVNEKEILDVFRESQNRVRSMALIHEKLYQSKDLANIDFDDYVRTLASNLFRSYKINVDIISLKINVDSVYLSVDMAIPCGLIINELVSNSLKYAFPSGKKGEILIDFHSQDNKFTLIVSDNGVGIPGDFDFLNTKSLGLKLVNTLTNQLEGTLDIDRSNGTKVTIRFSELKPSVRDGIRLGGKERG